MPDLNADAEKWLAQFDDDEPIAIDDLREAMRFAYADYAKICHDRFPYHLQEICQVTTTERAWGYAADKIRNAILARASKPEV